MNLEQKKQYSKLEQELEVLGVKVVGTKPKFSLWKVIVNIKSILEKIGEFLAFLKSMKDEDGINS